MSPKSHSESQTEPLLCGECGAKHRPGENTLCPGWRAVGSPYWWTEDLERAKDQEPIREPAGVPEAEQKLNEVPFLSEQVDHPAHYNWHPSGVECIDISEHFSKNIGSAIEYLWRHGRKSGGDAVQDLRKAVFYINREVALIERARTKGTP